MIKIYGVPMSRAMRCIWMLEELGVPYENVPTHFATKERLEPAYLALNPNGRIPTLDDDGVVVWESMAINLHLARKYDKGLWPADAVEQAHALQWSFWIMTEVEPSLLTAMMNRAFYPPDKRDPALADAAEQALQKPLGVLDAHLATRKHVLGERYGVADVNLASVLAWSAFAKVDLTKFPNVARWLAACMDRPAAKKALGR